VEVNSFSITPKETAKKNKKKEKGDETDREKTYPMKFSAKLLLKGGRQ
jgi:hypothetical protein